MTPSPTSEPDLELVTEPVAKTDPPETTNSAETVNADVAKTGATASAAGAPASVTDATDKTQPAVTETEPVSAQPVPAEAAPAEAAPAEAAPAQTVPVVAETTPAAAATPPGHTWAQPASEVLGDADPEGSDPDSADVADDDFEDGDPQDGDLEDALPYPPTEPGHYPTLVPLVGSLVALVALVAVMFGAFALPAVHGAPHHLPIGVAGPPAITKQVSSILDGLGGRNAHRYDITEYTQEAQLRTAIKERKVYGGLTVSDTAATMLVSTAASTVATQDLVTIANSIGGGQIQISITDVVPLPKKDPGGFGLASLAWPLVIASLLPALLMFRLYRRRASAQLAGTVAASVLLGLAVSALLTYWLDITAGADYWALSGALAAGVAATSLIVLGLGAIGGRIGVLVGAAAVLLISAPLSGFTSAPQWLPNPWNTIGQLLPAGAAGTVLRSTAFFHAHGAGTSLLILGAWALIGVVLLLVGSALLPVQDDEAVLLEADVIEFDLPSTQPAG